jgi:hypothetical protein
MDFWPFYGANNESSNILFVDAAGQVVPYDAGAITLGLETVPHLREPIGSESDPAVSLSVTLPDAHDPARPDALYVMDQTRGSFEALVYGDPSPYRLDSAFVWRWRQLPMPPFVREPNHGYIRSYALLPVSNGGGTICVSSMSDGVGTYCFDTASERWTKAGRWRLPFCGRAHVVPELDGLCFGVADRFPNDMCAVDLSSISMDDADSARQPKLRHRWPVMDTPDSSWSLTNTSMAYMGAGKFCIAKTFCIDNKDTGRSVDDEIVLISVEVVGENGGSATTSKLHMHDQRRGGSSQESTKEKEIYIQSPDDQAQVSSLRLTQPPHPCALNNTRVFMFNFGKM